ncbi:MAG: tetratricopeptide repeat protein [Planctomycetes bacterium]|nr:tetratricopeptide repeat protein [Planctomycetota bacterium]
MSSYSDPLVDSPVLSTPLSDRDGNEPLQRLCEALLAWMGRESSPGKSRILAELTRTLGQSCGDSLQMLRQEWQAVEEARQRLQSLATSSTIHLGDDGDSVLERLQDHSQQLSGVIDGLASIHSAAASPSAGPALRSYPTAHTAAPVSVWTKDTSDPPVSVVMPPESRPESAPCPPLMPAPDPTVSVWLQQGRRRLRQGDAAGAIEDLTHALGQNEHDSLAYCCRGDAHSLNRSFAAAIADYSRALEIQPNYFLPKYNRAVVYRLNGDLSEALEQFNEIVRLRPDHGSAYLNRGLVFELQGEFKQAELDYRKALRYSPKSSEALERLQAIRVLLPDKPEPVRRPAPADLSPTQSSVPPRDERPAKSDLDKIPARREIQDSLVVRCPSCDEETAIHWNKLQTGRVLTCPHCHTNYTTKPNGELGEVFKDATGRWLFRASFNARLRSIRERRLQIAGIVSVVVLLVMVWWVPRTSQSAPQSEASLPVDLEPRAELFARAWLAADSRTLRRLTDPVQDRLLFNWLRRNPPPHVAVSPDELEKTLKCEVTRLPGQPPTTWVQVRVAGFEGSSGAPIEMRLAWEARSDVWHFQPNPQL